MLIPPAFHKLCIYFFQDIGLSFSTPEEWVAFAGRHLNQNEKSIVKEFLSNLLRENHDDTELHRMWFDSGAEIYFPDAKELRGFLSLIHDRIEGMSQ